MIGIDAFARELRALPSSDFTLEGVDTFLRANPVEPSSLAPYLHYEATHYTRHLIDRCERYELLAICWEVGQASSIHNHSGQRCWMTAPIGRLAVQNYKALRQDEATGFCELVETDRVDMDSAHPAFVRPEEPIHAVLNLSEFAARATSLHVYSLPYDRCLVYSKEAQTCREIPLFFDTEYGRPARD
ncbi:MAG TPA: cysteine dioxygenase family protein [Vicinamibacteria bacterium]